MKETNMAMIEGGEGSSSARKKIYTLAEGEAAIIIAVKNSTDMDGDPCDRENLYVTGHDGQAKTIAKAIVKTYYEDNVYRYKFMALLERPMFDCSEFELAHKHSFKSRTEILLSKQCRCIHCLSVFQPGEIEWWTDSDEYDRCHTALCPRCGLDAVIGDKSGVSFDDEFFKKLSIRWFGTTDAPWRWRGLEEK
jgi:hypothetical protein